MVKSTDQGGLEKKSLFQTSMDHNTHEFTVAMAAYPRSAQEHVSHHSSMEDRKTHVSLPFTEE